MFSQEFIPRKLAEYTFGVILLNLSHDQKEDPYLTQGYRAWSRYMYLYYFERNLVCPPYLDRLGHF